MNTELQEQARAEAREQALLDDASPEARVALLRIQKQRERLHGRAMAQAQIQSWRHSDPDYAMSHGSLVERLIGFGRQHPVVCAGLLGVGLLIGPRKLMRVATIALPWVLKLRR